MKARLLGLVLPASVVGVIVGAGYGGSVLGFIPQPVWDYLWPSLVAFGFLALSVGALLIGARRLLWPLLTGFVVQTIGILLMWGDVYESPWEPLLYTLIAVGFVVLIMLVLWLVATLRARWLEKMMIDGVGAGGADQQKIAEIRKNMLEALSLLKRAGCGRNAIYELPWFLVIGRSQAGKTVAIKNSGLGLPVRKDRVKGVGGTHTCDMFFTNDLIFLDTPGAWVTEGAGEGGQKYWVEVLRFLRKYRGRRPLDGLVVLVPADDLLSRSEPELQEQASNIRQVIDLLHDELRFRFPVYLLVSKCDLVEGFVDFFKGLPAQRRNEILGWSHPDPNEGDPRRLIPQGFQRVVQRLQAYRLEILARIAKTTQARRLFFFTEEFRNLEKPLTMFASVLFADDPYHEPPVFRGFYFTSGTQGEGSPLGQAMGNLARTLGVRLGQPQAGGEEEQKRGYFLLDLFRNLLVGDQGLVSRTAIHWWRWRRDTMFVAFLPACLATLGFGLSSLSFLLNNKTYGDIGSEVPRIVKDLREYRHPTGKSVIEVLRLTDEIRQYHRKLTGFTLLRRFGMRRPGELADQTLAVFRDQFKGAILAPTLEDAEKFAIDPEQTCTDRADAFFSVVWLREGHRGEWSDDLRALDKIWSLQGEDAREARQRLLQQFGYLIDQGQSNGSLLPGFSLVKVAKSLVDVCSEEGAGSSLELYVRFQEDCRAPSNNCEITNCGRTQLRRVLQYEEEDFERLRGHLEGLKKALRNLREGELEAEGALDLVEQIPLPNPKANKCLTDFSESIVPEISLYMEQKKLVEECKKEWSASGKKPLVAQKQVRDQEETLKDQQKKLSGRMQEYTETCGDRALSRDFDLDGHALFRLAKDFRRIACQNQDNCAEPPPPQPLPGGVRPKPHEQPLTPPPPPPVVPKSALVYFDPLRQAPRGYSLTAWTTKRQEWVEQVEYAKDLSSGQRMEVLRPVQREIEDYAADYASAWKGYLGSLRLKESKGSIPGWLKGLADTNEFEKLLRPAAQAVPSVGSDEEPPFSAFNQRLESLSSLKSFVDARLGDYQSKLGDIANDLEKCEQSSGFLQQYLAQIAGQDETNRLVKARTWVDQEAGAVLAEGAMKGLFMQPLEEAQKYVRSPNLARKQWGDLLALYESVSTRFPLGGEDAEGMADLKDLTALLGGQSGLVPVLQSAAGSLEISPAAREWLGSAAPLSRILFEEGKDTPRPLRVKFTVDDPTFDPEELRKDFLVETIQVYFGEGDEFTWEADKPRAKTLGMKLLGEDPHTYSFAAATVAARKGAVGRMVGKDFKKGERMEAVKIEGEWAPLKLLARGLAGAAERGHAGDALNLIYTIEVPYKKNQPGKLKLAVRAEANGLGRLLRLMQDGLSGPPSSITGE